MKRNFEKVISVAAVVSVMAVLLCATVLFFNTQSVSFAQENVSTSFSIKAGTVADSGHNLSNIMDGNTNTKWFVENAFNTSAETGQRTPYVVFEASQAVKITGYSFTTGDDTATYSDRNPKSWILYGSNTYDAAEEPDYNNILPADYSSSVEPSNWTILDTVTDDTVLQAANKIKYSFDVDQDKQGEYKYYKFVIYASNGGGNIQLSEINIEYEDNRFFTVLSATAGNDSEGAENLFDGKKSDNNTSKWCVSSYTSGTYINVIFKAQRSIVVSGYTLVTGNDNEKYGGRNPKSWVLAGSNDEGSTWNSIHNVSNDTTMEDKNHTSYTFMVNNNRSYQYYMLQISANQGSNVIQLSELELIYSDCEHTWVEGDATAADCTTYAYKNYTCGTCNESISVLSGEPLGHDFVTESTESATCTVAEKLHQKCSRCDTTQTIDGEPAKGHTWSDEEGYCSVSTEPTCTTDGVMTYTCTVEGCDGTKTEAIDAYGHKWGASILVSNATCTRAIVMQHTCGACELTEEYSKGTALGHAYQNGTCVRCGKSETAGVTVGAFVVIGGEKDVDYKYEENIKSVNNNKHSTYNVLTILTSTPLTISNVDPDTATATDRIFIAKDVSANITLAGVNIDLSWSSYDNSGNLGDSAISMADNSRGDVVITLANGTVNYAKSGKSSAGIQKNSPYGSLTINGTGTLHAYGGQYGAGIGSGRGSGADLAAMCVTNITIEDCTIIAKGGRITSGGVANNNGNYGAASGIGSGFPSDWASSVSYDANIRIINATVTAEGLGSSGIGPTGNGHMGGIVIEGGSVLSTQSNVCRNTSVNDAIGGISSKLEAPVNSSGDSVALIAIPNPNGAIIRIESEYKSYYYVPIAHSATDTNVYAYLPATGAYTITVGNRYKQYRWNGSAFEAFNEDWQTDEESAPKAFTVTATYFATITLGEDYTYTEGVLTILSDTPMTISSSGLATTDRIVISAANAKITLDNVNIDVSEITDNVPALSVNGVSGVYIYLAEGSVNTLKSGYGCAGLQITGTENDTTFIQGIDGTSVPGILDAYGGNGGAGIGSANNGTVGTINIAEYAIINAYGGEGGAGIGSGMSASYFAISINNSNILAIGGNNGAGIGTGYNANAGTGASIDISGGVVSVIGGKDADGIGCGQLAAGNSDIALINTTVYALGGNSDGTTAGYGINGKSIAITQSSVNAMGGLDDSGSQKAAFGNTPVNRDGTELNLLVVANPDGKVVKVDETTWNPANSALMEDTNLYLYLTGDCHVIKVGDRENKYYYVDGGWHISSGLIVSDGEGHHYYRCIDDGCEAELGKVECTVDTSKWYINGDKHYHVCTEQMCPNIFDMTEHTYDQNVENDDYLQKAATCTDYAWYYRSCECGQCNRDETNVFYKAGSILEHNFVYPEGEDVVYCPADNGHSIVCSRCGLISNGKYEPHIYEHDCSKNCSICDYPRSEEELTHDYDTTTWAEYNNGHAHKCKYCDEYTDYADHVFKNENGKYNYKTEYVGDVYKHAVVCTVCGTIEGNDWTECTFVYKYNETNHWYECSSCGFIKPDTETEHTFDNDCDTSCNDCDYTRTATHNYNETTWVSDNTYHWHECSVCGDKKDVQQHLLTTDYDEDGHWERCTICGKTNINYQEHSYNSGEYICNGCGYVSATPIITADQPRLNFTYSGYEVGENTKNLKVISDKDNFGINWDNDEICGYYWWIIADFEDYMTEYSDNSTLYSYWTFNSYGNPSDPVEINNYFRTNTNYWLGLYLEADDDHYFDGFRQGNVYIDGLGYPMYVYTQDEDYGWVYAYFELPVLEGDDVKIESMPEMQFELTGNYTLGESILTVDNITGKTVFNFEVAPSGIYRTWAFEYYTTFMIRNTYSSNEYFYQGIVFEENTSYGLNITIFASEGYDFSSYDLNSITLEVGDTVCAADWYSIYCDGKCGVIEYSFSLPTFGEHEHTWIWGNWGSDSHYKKCSVCGEYDYSAGWEHVYDDENDCICDCGYVRMLYIEELQFDLVDYEFGKPVNGIGITPSEGFENYVLSQEGQYALQIMYYYYLSGGELTNYVEVEQDDTSGILAGEKYMIMFILAPAVYYTNTNGNGYSYSFENLLSENIKINGVSALAISDSGSYAIITAELPVLEGDDRVSRITEVEYTLVGYEIDRKLADLSLTSVKDTGIEGYSLTISYDGNDFDATSTPELTFNKGTTYRIEITLQASENYSFINLTESGLKVNGAYELEYFKLLDIEGTQLKVIYSLLNITESEHNHRFYWSYGGYDSYRHWDGCECGMKYNVEEHIFVDGSPYCIKCGYNGANDIKSITLYLENYEYSCYAGCLVIRHTDSRIDDIESFGNGFKIGTSITVKYGDGSGALSQNDYLTNDVEYYLAVQLNTSSSKYNFYYGLTADDISLEGHGTAVDVIHYGSDNIIVTFKLNEILLPHVHTWSEDDIVGEVPSTCGTEGTVAHYICTVCGKAVDKDGKELSASDLAIPVNLDAHTYAMQYDDEYHVKFCKECGHYSEAGYHVYDNGSDCTCNVEGCGYVREPLPENISFSISDYVVGGKITDIKVELSDEARGLYWESSAWSTVSYADYWWQIITDLDAHFAAMNDDGHNYQNYNYYTAEGGYFRPAADYWLIVWIEAYDGTYRLSGLTNEDIYLEGVGVAIYFDTYYVDQGYHYGYAYFKLPTLSGDCDVETMPDIELELNGYAIDSAIGNATIALRSDYAVTDATISYEFLAKNTYPNDGALFSDSEFYSVRIAIIAGAGYDFYGFTEDKISIKGIENIKVLEYIVYPGHTGVYVLIELPTLSHTHTYGDWTAFTDSETQHCKSCTICGYTICADHTYDDDNDCTCNDCGYTRKITISSLEFVLSGYEIDAPAGDVKITVAEGYEKYIYSDEGNGYYISMDALFYAPDGQMSSNSLRLFSSNFLSGPEYGVMMSFEIADGYVLADSYSVMLSGTEISFIYSSGNEYMAVFVLPKLTGEGQIKKVSDIEYNLNGYESGKKLADFSLEAVNAEGVTISGIKLYYGEDFKEFDPTVTPDLIFEVNTQYGIAIQLAVDETYTFIGTSADTFRLNGNVILDSIVYNNDYTQVFLAYVLQEFVGEEHVHQYNEYLYNDSVHWLSCDCFAAGAESEHVYDDDFDETCNVCGYTRKIELTKVTLYLSGYAFGNVAEKVSVTHLNQYLYSFNGNDYGSYYYLSTCSDIGKTNQSSFVDENEIICAGVEYYLVIRLKSYQGAGLYGLKQENIILDGYGHAEQIMDIAGELYVSFKLPVLFEPHEHVGDWVDEVPATCVDTGVKAHRECTVCGKYFDAEGKEIDDLTIEIDSAAHSFGEWVNEVSANYIETGIKGHKDCTVCGKHFDADGNEIADLTIAKLDEPIEPSTPREESKESLSGGAIAGIVVGGIAVTGTGGFAIFWFVIKKKKFADLLAVFKNLFGKK